MATVVTFLAPLDSPQQHPADRLHAGTATKIKFEVVKRDLVTAVNLTGLTPKFRAKEHQRDASYLVDKAGSVTDAEDGLCEVDLAATDLPDPLLVWAELSLQDSGGDQVGRVAFRLPVLEGASV